MTLTRIAAAVSTMIVAIVLALGVPFAQLATHSDRVTCCCPDPDRCKCPDHKPDHSGQTSLRACHRQAPDAVRTQLAAFVPPPIVHVIAPAVPVPHVSYVHASPHAAPAPRRPDAPS